MSIEELQKTLDKKAKTVWELECEHCIWKGHTLEDPNPDVEWVPREDVTALLVKVSEVKTEAVQLLGKLENWATRKHFGDFDPELVFILEKVRKVLDK